MITASFLFKKELQILSLYLYPDCCVTGNDYNRFAAERHKGFFIRLLKIGIVLALFEIVLFAYRCVVFDKPACKRLLIYSRPSSQ